MGEHVNTNDEVWKQWLILITSDKICKVISKVKGHTLDGKQKVECLVAVSQLVCDSLKNAKECKSSADEIIQLVEMLCSSSVPKESTLRYLVCLYHITRFLLEKNKFDHMKTVLNCILEFKQTNSEPYKEDAKSLHEPLTSLIQKAIWKLASLENGHSNHSSVQVFFSLLLQIHDVEHCSITLLENILQIAQVLSKQDRRITVIITSAGLNVFYGAENTIDSNVTLSLLLRCFTILFGSQQSVEGSVSALGAVAEHLKCAEQKFASSGNLVQAECLQLVYSFAYIFKGVCTGTSLLKNIKDSKVILNKLQSYQTEKSLYCTYAFIIHLLVYSNLTGPNVKINIFPGCVEQLMCIVVQLCILLKDQPCHNLHVLRALCDLLLFLVGVEKHYSKTELITCMPHVLRITECFNRIINLSPPNEEMRKETKLILGRLANVCVGYRETDLKESLIKISKSMCKFILKLPSNTVEDPLSSKAIVKCFCSYVWALGCDQLAQAQYSMVIWMAKFPCHLPLALRCWTDLKHNVVCEGQDSDGLETNICSIVNERNAELENEWGPINLSTDDIANYLVQELKYYAKDRSLRGKPVLSAADALLSLNVDCLTQGMGLAIALDVATSNPALGDSYSAYHAKAKLLISKLKKQKDAVDPVKSNCCLGDLLYGHFRCKLKDWRTACDTEMVKLTVEPRQPLVAERPEDRPDPNDTCDVATMYQHLTLARQRSLMEVMDAALNHWSIAFDQLEGQEELDLEVTLVNLRDAGMLLRLYCEEKREVRAWNLLYHLALATGNINMAVRAGSELMTTNSEVATSIKPNLEDLVSNDSSITEATVMTYTLSCARSALQQRRMSEGWELLKSLDLSKKLPGIKLCQLLTLAGQFQSVPEFKDYNDTSISASLHLSFHRSLVVLLQLVRSLQWESFGDLCEDQLELVKVSGLISEVNWRMNLPREARMYLKAALPTAQKLGLPLRVAQMLLLLAWVDLHTGMTADCAVKLEGLTALLELPSTPLATDTSPQSPVLHPRNTHALTAYLSGLPSCTMEYRRLILETLTLRAAYSTAFGPTTEPAHTFRVAKQLEKDLRNCDKRDVLNTCARMWLCYANYNANKHQYQEALDANTAAIEMLPSIGDHITAQLAHEQRVTLQFLVNPVFCAPLGTKAVIHSKGMKDTPSKLYTPPLMKSKVTAASPLTTIDTNIKITPFKRPVRPFRIFTSDEENSPNIVTKRPTRLKTITSKQRYKNSNSSKKPFVIALDDEDEDGTVTASSTKSMLHSRIKTVDLTTSAKKDNSASKKQLFPSDSKKTRAPKTNTCPKSAIVTKSDINTTLSPIERSLIGSDESSIVRKSRLTGVKSYINKKSSSRSGTAQHNDKVETEKQNLERTKVGASEDVFTFDQLKDSISEIDQPKTAAESDPTKVSLLSLKSSSETTITNTLTSKTSTIKPIHRKRITSDSVHGIPPAYDPKVLSPTRKSSVPIDIIRKSRNIGMKLRQKSVQTRSKLETKPNLFEKRVDTSTDFTPNHLQNTINEIGKPQTDSVKQSKLETTSSNKVNSKSIVSKIQSVYTSADKGNNTKIQKDDSIDSACDIVQGSPPPEYPKKKGNLRHTKTQKDSIDSACDIVQGLPPPEYPKKKGNLRHTKKQKDSIDSACDIVLGTPSPESPNKKGSLRLARATRLVKK